MANIVPPKNRNIPVNSFNLKNIYQEIVDMFIPQIKKKKNRVEDS